MATKKEPLNTNDKIEVKKSLSKKMKIIILLIILLFCSIGGSGAYYMMSHSDKKEDQEGRKKSEPSIYVNLDQFTVNLIADTAQFLQISISAEIKNEKQNQVFTTYKPLIRNKLILLLSSKKKEDLMTKEGKEKLQEEIQLEIENCFPEELEDKKIIKVYFNSMIIQ